MRTTRFGLLLLLIILLGFAAQAPAVTYQLTDLTTTWTNLGVNAPVASAISPDGHTIVGHMSVYDADKGLYYEHAFQYANGAVTDLQPATTGNVESDWLYSRATGVNNAGQVSGSFRHRNPNEIGMLGHPFLYNPNGSTITTLPGNESGQVVSVNASGQVSGSHTVEINENESAQYAYLWSGVAATSLAPISGNTDASWSYGVNDSGWVAGDSDVSLGIHAFVNRPDGAGGRETIDLGVFPNGESQSHATAINNAGAVVGWANSDSVSSHAFLVTQDSQGVYGALQDLGTVSNEIGGSSFAHAINQDGLIVGQSSIVGENYMSAGFLYDGSGMHDLNDSLSATDKTNWVIADAIAIADMGQILAWANYTDDGYATSRYVLLTPTPEPSTFALLVAGVASLLGYAWRRRRLAR